MSEQSTTPDPQGRDVDLVREAITRYRALARAFRYGGLGYDHKLANAARDAFERIMSPALPGMEAGQWNSD